MRERDPERRRLGGQAVGDGQRMELAAHREGVDGHLRPVDELLDDRRAAAGLCDRARDRGRELVLGAHERQALLPLPVGRLDDPGARNSLLQRLVGSLDDLPARLGHAGLREALALLLLGDGEARSRRVDRVRQAVALGDPCGDPDRPVDPGRDQPVDGLRVGQTLDALLVLGRDDRPPVRVLEPGRSRVAVERDHEEPSLAGRREQAELSRSRP